MILLIHLGKKLLPRHEPLIQQRQALIQANAIEVTMSVHENKVLQEKLCSVLRELRCKLFCGNLDISCRFAGNSLYVLDDLLGRVVVCRREDLLLQETLTVIDDSLDEFACILVSSFGFDVACS